MALIGEKEQTQLREIFAQLQGPVKLVFFTQEQECQFCRETHQLVEEVAALSDRIALEVYDFQADKEQVERYHVDKIPAIALIGAKDYGVRFYGIPSGYEFGALVQDLVDVANGTTELNAKTKAALSTLQEPVHFQVFSTPTCPYCPGMVRLTHQMAIESDLVTADAIEAIEFPHLSIKYRVQGVPRTLANETIVIEGLVPEGRLVKEVLDGLKRKKG